MPKYLIENTSTRKSKETTASNERAAINITGWPARVCTVKQWYKRGGWRSTREQRARAKAITQTEMFKYPEWDGKERIK